MESQSQIQREEKEVSKHYEINPQAFRYFLDSRMNYSCGYFYSDEDSLDKAQESKLELIARKLGIGSQDRVLDVGCGWGNSLYLAEKYGCDLVGVTLASNQRDFCLKAAKEKGLTGRVNILQGHFQEIDFPPESFTKVMFIGSIIHIEDREGTVRKCFNLLKPGGLMLISETYYPNHSVEQHSRAAEFVKYSVFGYSNLLTVAEEQKILENAGFEICHVENITKHYIKTINKWLENIRRNKDEIERIAEGESKRLRSYLFIAKKSLLTHTALQFQILSRKN